MSGAALGRVKGDEDQHSGSGSVDDDVDTDLAPLLTPTSSCLSAILPLSLSLLQEINLLLHGLGHMKNIQGYTLVY